LVSDFKFQAKWPALRTSTRAGADPTFCKFQINVGGVNITSYQTEGGLEEDHLEIPAYHIAEWLAENWWPILWEPRKSEDAGEDPDFLSRHLLSTAEHGFALPNLRIIPTGEKIHLFATGRTPRYADAQFRRTPEALVSRQHVEAELRQFVEQTVARLGSELNSPLQSAWDFVKNTDNESEKFCRLMGALGLSPYETHGSIERALDDASSILTDPQLLDLCLTSTPDNVIRSAYVAGLMQTLLAKESEIYLSAVETLSPPRDQGGAPAWRVGYAAAKALREHFSVNEQDIDGASIVFEKLRLDPSSRQPDEFRGIESPLAGGIEKHQFRGRMVLSPEGKQSRRSAAARATYFFWTAGQDDRRLITNAVTRDQQTSRAFAAELLAPQSYVRTQSAGMKLKWDQLNQIAERANVAPEVIKFQAHNNGLQLVQ
jgi:hypothetical protein